ncbi:MAG: FtsK/SpoIIIE domain-containing protein [Acidimicrobiales bacterium]
MEEYTAALARWAANERAARDRALPALADLVDVARTGRPPLWLRSRDGEDLLTVRLGTSELRPAPHLDVVVDVPRDLDLDEAVIVSFHGDVGDVDGLVRSVLGQIVIHHRPDDVAVVALLAPSALRAFEWLRWLPHVRSPSSPLTGEHLAAWPDAIAEIVTALLDLEAGREGARIVLVIHEDAEIDSEARDRLLAGAGDRGIRVVWLGRDEHRVPSGCGAVIFVSDETFRADGVEVRTLDVLARHLAARNRSMPRIVGLTDVLGGPPAPADIASAWSVSDVGFLDAPVGLNADGPVSVDLVDQGPHALVTGAAGSGTTELLRTWVAVLAARHPPERVTFLFTDHDGDAASSLAGLPHDVGLPLDIGVSDLEGWLRDELDRRTALLGGRDLTEVAAADPACPPRLVVVVEDFRGSFPGLADVAECGGELGVHLIVAARSPAQLDEELLACTDLRISLRLDDRADSERMLGAGDAADIPVVLAGRAFAWLGAAALESFQVAWAGAPMESRLPSRVRVEPLGFGRAPGQVAAPAPIEATTQLAVVLRAVGLAAERSGRRVAPVPIRD